MLLKSITNQLFPALSLIFFVSAAFAHATDNKDGDTTQGGMAQTGLYESTGDEEFAAPKPGTYKLPPIKLAGDGKILDHDGQKTTLKKLMAGRISIVSFIYTSCDDPKGCPLATAKLFDLHDLSMNHPEIVKNAKLISLSFDPEHDTPDVMKNYGSAAIEDEDAAKKIPWAFATTKSKSEINQILAQYGQVIDKRGTSSTISHLLRLYLVDRAGVVRNIYGLGFLDQRLLLADINTLLIEESRAAKNAGQ